MPRSPAGAGAVRPGSLTVRARRKLAGMRRVSGAKLGATARATHVCDWCGCQHASRPLECQSCGRAGEFIRFDSIKEANRWAALLLQLRAGMISDLRRQVRIPLVAYAGSGRPVKVGDYIADFTYREEGEPIIEDVKSGNAIDPLAAWKLRHVKAQTGNDVRIT